MRTRRHRRAEALVSARQCSPQFPLRPYNQRTFFYLFTCEYCFSHYVTLGFRFITRYRLLYEDWRGYVIAGFSLVWVANVYMSAFGRLRLEIKHERVELGVEEALVGGKAKPQEPARTEALNQAEEARRRESTEDNAGGVRVERRVTP